MAMTCKNSSSKTNTSKKSVSKPTSTTSNSTKTKSSGIVSICTSKEWESKLNELVSNCTKLTPNLRSMMDYSSKLLLDSLKHDDNSIKDVDVNELMKNAFNDKSKLDSITKKLDKYIKFKYDDKLVSHIERIPSGLLLMFRLSTSTLKTVKSHKTNSVRLDAITAILKDKPSMYFSMKKTVKSLKGLHYNNTTGALLPEFL